MHCLSLRAVLLTRTGNEEVVLNDLFSFFYPIDYVLVSQPERSNHVLFWWAYLSSDIFLMIINELHIGKTSQGHVIRVSTVISYVRQSCSKVTTKL